MSLCLSRHLPVALGSFLTHNIFCWWPGAWLGIRGILLSFTLRKLPRGQAIKGPLLAGFLCFHWGIRLGDGTRPLAQSHTPAFRSSKENDGKLLVHPEVDTLL